MPRDIEVITEIGQRVHKALYEVVLQSSAEYKELSMEDGMIGIAAGIYSALIGDRTDKSSCEITAILLAAISHIHDSQHIAVNNLKERARFN